MCFHRRPASNPALTVTGKIGVPPSSSPHSCAGPTAAATTQHPCRDGTAVANPCPNSPQIAACGAHPVAPAEMPFVAVRRRTASPRGDADNACQDQHHRGDDQNIPGRKTFFRCHWLPLQCGGILSTTYRQVIHMNASAAGGGEKDVSTWSLRDCYLVINHFNALTPRLWWRRINSSR